MSIKSVSIISYTEKSIVVVGDTKQHKDSLKTLGGKWNSSLTNKETGEKFMGWIFYNSKRNEIQNWIDSGCLPLDLQENKSETKLDNRQESKQESKRVETRSSDDDRIRQLEKTVQTLLSKLTLLESEVKLLKNSKSIPNGDTEYEDVVEEEIQIPTRRLLRR
jgi:hypothetical protein